MKRAISILLVLIICLSMCACGVSKDQVRDDIIDKRWYGSIDAYDGAGWISYNVRFSYAYTATVEWTSGVDGIYDVNGYIPGTTSSLRWEGPYTIENNRIIVSDGGKDIIIYYTYENGEIDLTVKNDEGNVPLKIMPANAI